MKISNSEPLIEKLRNVLMTYTKRNPTTGYCQGMNFLVGRLLKTMQFKSADAHMSKLEEIFFKYQEEED